MFLQMVVVAAAAMAVGGALGYVLYVVFDRWL